MERKRLKKLVEVKPPPVQELIPKKHKSQQSKTILRPVNEQDSDQDDFISDNIVFQDRGGPPQSSSESAHSTDQEALFRKRPRIQPQSGPESQEQEASESQSNQQPQLRLVGKQALQAKRAKGLLPSRRTSKPQQESKSRPLSKKKQKQEKKTKKIEKKSNGNSKKSVAKKYTQFAEFDSKKDRKKAEIVTKIMVRWWYALDPWPPADYDYLPALFENKLRVVPEANWSVEPTVDQRGYQKVLEVSGFPGLFKNYIGKVFDLRPKENMPSFNNLFYKNKTELEEILLKALRNQLDVLEQQSKVDVDLRSHLKKEISYWNKNK